MDKRLRHEGLPALTDQYEESISNWRDVTKMATADKWLEVHEAAIEGWLSDRAIAAHADFGAIL